MIRYNKNELAIAACIEGSYLMSGPDRDQKLLTPDFQFPSWEGLGVG
ncbi:MAG: hypothetical protein F6K40_35060 [Okeania sp. SIO3I5]|nr:hypothetical protein [Okeania sp. SIO3I5]NEQ41145.1 hypothetical protein [Okeania sp. SIO3I5]